VIVMSNGEKTVPAPLESAILAHPLVQGAIVFGRGRDRVGIIIELKTEVAVAKNDSELASLRDVFW
jgi:long-subunit acyl-CoA synthetase (AMP-forming)